MKKYVLLFLTIGFFYVGCKKNDDGIGGPNGPDPTTADVTVQDFMWKAMNIWYFWQADVPDLADNRFSNDQEYTEFLQTESDPADFFDNKLRFSEDRFSFYNMDYKELTDNLSGVSRSNGLEFGLIVFQGSDDIFGYVRYIIANSDASTKDISRGELFTGVDGQTLNRDNYRDLLFGENATYTLNMADIENDVITPNGKEVTLTKEEALVENPVFITTSFEISGVKIGYLMYNGFTNEFDEDLNDAFGQLKSAGVTELVLDMRYNSGGSVNSSRLLSSMIYGTNTDELYIKQRWNDKIQEAFTADDPNALNDYFASSTGDGSPINTLNLTRVYVLTTGSTASASELVINGLDPYLDVIKVGTTTTGKNEFSLTMVDDPSRDGAPFIYTPSRENQINPNNLWAIQPLVGRNENSVGFSDYTAGFSADIELEEDLANLGILGDLNEPLLARAIDEILGVSSKRDFTVKHPVELITSSKMFRPIKDNMILDKEFYLPLLD
ncbi:S41 family peptidase [Muriicola sp. Z0-33]|uniref:S41 family peptidase n=1 Tax=Muriicola sp. Z0-33 TaxID=2816957 RepID=UPI002238A3B7|nr:S41 family peptidase [Muriicola sp. Z0-33]MCW5517083.1 carboxyl-terminal protease [Muriicola sp. Z0-33]